MSSEPLIYVQFRTRAQGATALYIMLISVSQFIRRLVLSQLTIITASKMCLWNES